MIPQKVGMYWPANHCTELHFASFLSGIFTTIALKNPPERKLTKQTSVHCVRFMLIYVTENCICK